VQGSKFIGYRSVSYSVTNVGNGFTCLRIFIFSFIHCFPTGFNWFFFLLSLLSIIIPGRTLTHDGGEATQTQNRQHFFLW